MFLITSLSEFVAPDRVAIGTPVYTSIPYSDVLAYRTSAGSAHIGILLIRQIESPQRIDESIIDATARR